MKKKPIYAFLLLTLPTLVVVMVVLILMNWRIPTRFQIDFIVDRAVFTVGDTDSTPILNQVSFQSITIEKFAHIKFNPERLEVADPAQYKQTEDQHSKSAWKSLTVTPPLVITGEDETLQPAVTLESAKPELNTLGALDWVRARPGSKVTLEVRGDKKIDFTLKVSRRESDAALSIRKPFQLITDYCLFSGITGLSYPMDSLTYRIQLPNHSPFIEITGQPRSLVLILTISPEKATNLFSKSGIPVTALDFTRQNPKGEPETTLVKDGKITYPDYPKIDEVSFKASDFIGLARLEKFRIAEIALEPKHKGIRFGLDGVAGHLRTGSHAFPKDHRLTLFDTLWQNPRLTILFSIIV